MRNIRINRGKCGVYTTTPRLLRFREQTLINEKDIENLFIGFFRLLKSTIAESLESQYISRITRLENELKKYKGKGCV